MRRQINIFFLFLVCAHFIGIGQDLKQLPTNSLTSDIDFTKISVNEYVDLLKIRDQKKDQLHFLSVNQNAPENWLQKSDVHFLMKYITSKEPANCVVHVRSSHLPFQDSSTIGGQVMNLIDSFRFKKEYPYFLEDCSKTDKKRIAEIKKWWEENSKTK